MIILKDCILLIYFCMDDTYPYLFQTMYTSSKPGSIYVIDCECRTPTIPYGDSFYIINRYCLTRVADTKSRLHITSQIVYLKNVFFKSKLNLVDFYVL